jgi:hypothetical protein
MRDSGFDFRWYDRHASNDYARGFEYEPGEPCEFLTAFEVLEHLTDPVADLEGMMEIAENLFVSTMLVPEPTPKIADWWYYMPSSGQHISFHTRESLRLLAKRFGRQLLSHGSYHLFCRRPQNRFRFLLASRFKTSRLLNLAFRRPTLLDQDFRDMVHQVASSAGVDSAVHGLAKTDAGHEEIDPPLENTGGPLVEHPAKLHPTPVDVDISVAPGDCRPLLDR